MKKVALTLLLLSALSAVAQKRNVTPVDQRLVGVDEKLQALLADWHVAGFAVAVVEKNKIVYAKGFGYRDLANKKPVTPNTLFAIGSCSKAFTSGLLGILRGDSKLSFDEKPSTYLPDLRFFNDEMNAAITVKDLMRHSTGLPRHDYSWYFFNTPSRDSLIRRIRFFEPSAHVRERWQYNNFMFLAQGVIAEKITGHSWEDNIREKYFTPLGMTTSNTSIAALEKSAEPSKGYDTKNNTTIVETDYYNIDGMGPAGSINSSVNEMANWLKVWIHGGKFNGKEILPAAYVSEALSSQMIIGGAAPTPEHPDIHFSTYGYGWFLASYKGHYRVEHGGNINGFSASTSFFPSDSIGIVVLVNQNGSSVPSIARNILADRMLRVTPTDWNKELRERFDKNQKESKEADAKRTASAHKGTRPSHLLEEFEGKYSLDGYGAILIRLSHDSLFATLGHQRVWLRHNQYDLFEPFYVDKKLGIDTSQHGGQRFNFITGLTGEVERVAINDMEPSLNHPLEFTRQLIAKTISAAELHQYEGDYELGAMVAKVAVKAEKALSLTVPGQPEYELVYLGADKFAIKNLNGYKVEFERTGGKITGCAFVQPNGTFKAKKK